VSSAWLIWWSLLCAAAAVNVAAWLGSAWLLRRREPHLTPAVRAARRRLLVLSLIYVAGCAFRSVLPMVDVPRICLHDTWISRILVGRLVATAAELCFAAQWALLLREAGYGGSRLAAGVARVLFPMIVVAELLSWGAVLTTNNLLHAAENSLWTLAAVLAVAGCISVRPQLGARGREFLAAAVACGLAYVAFMVVIDVPMYLARWQADLAAAHPYLSLAEGLGELLERCVVTRDWSAWREDAPWLTLYFTFAVWVSIALPHAPPLHGGQRG
jgi:hypothetical protein